MAINEKPKCPLIGQNGNIYNLAGLATITLKENGMSAQAEEMQKRIFSSHSYYEALNVIGEYVEICSVEEMNEEPDECMSMM